MDLRVMAAVTSSERVLDVSKFCREHGISRKTFYKWRARYQREGLAGLEEHSRRPRRSPRQTPVEIEDQIVELRKQLSDEGLDAGAATIRWHLGRRGHQGERLPSEATIWRVLVRRGFVTPEPKKRPKKAWRRFAAAFPNECWQIDATEWHLADGAKVEIVNILDDHSRLVVASSAVVTTTCENAWAAFSSAVARFGLPMRCLSDNGLAFSGRLRGYVVAFEANLRAAGVVAVTSRPFHPQTCGKVERFQQTLKKWLGARELPQTLGELQALLDSFIAYYDEERPHRGIGRRTPLECWTATPRAAGGGSVPAPPTRRTQACVSSRGAIELARFVIHVGVEHSGREAVVFIDGTTASVFVEGILVRHLELDLSRRYQPSGRPPGGRPGPQG